MTLNLVDCHFLKKAILKPGQHLKINSSCTIQVNDSSEAFLEIYGEKKRVSPFCAFSVQSSEYLLLDEKNIGLIEILPGEKGTHLGSRLCTSLAFFLKSFERSYLSLSPVEAQKIRAFGLLIMKRGFCLFLILFSPVTLSSCFETAHAPNRVTRVLTATEETYASAVTLLQSVAESASRSADAPSQEFTVEGKGGEVMPYQVLDLVEPEQVLVREVVSEVSRPKGSMKRCKTEEPVSEDVLKFLSETKRAALKERKKCR